MCLGIPGRVVGMLDGYGDQLALVDVADRHDVAETGGALGVAHSHAAAANQSHAGPIVWRSDGGCLPGGGELALDEPQREACCSRECSAVADECAAGDLNGF